MVLCQIRHGEPIRCPHIPRLTALLTGRGPWLFDRLPVFVCEFLPWHSPAFLSDLMPPPPQVLAAKQEVTEWASLDGEEAHQDESTDEGGSHDEEVFGEEGESGQEEVSDEEFTDEDYL